MTPSGPGRSGSFFEITILFTLFVAAAYGFGLYLFPAIAPTMRQSFGFSFTTMGAISSVVQIGFLASALLSGVMSLRFGSLRVILGSIVLCAGALSLVSVTSNVLIFSVLLFVLGCCAASIWVPMVEVSQALIPKSHQGKALGLMSSGTSYGVIVNGFFITYVLGAYGWRWTWAVAAMLTALLAAVALVRLGRRSVSADRSQMRSDVGAPLGFVESCRRLRHPVTYGVLLMMFFNGLSCIPYQTYLASFLQEERGLAESVSADVWRTIGLVGTVSGFAVGALSDRISVRLTMVLTYLVLALAAGLILVSTEHRALLLAGFLFGLAFYPIFGLVPAYISHTYKGPSATTLFAVGNIALGLGGMFGNFLGGALRDATGSFMTIYQIIVAGAVASAILALVLPSEGRWTFASAGPE
jgi:predicted MFS family arabinose efflux permease